MDEFIFGEAFKKTIIIGNPVNISAIRKSSCEKLPEEILQKAQADIVFLGRLTPPKNIFFC